MESVLVLDSLRTNLAREVTDNIPCCLPLSAHYGLYRMLLAVEPGAKPVPEPASCKPGPLKDSIVRHLVDPCIPGRPAAGYQG